jgi:hypothetical protein
MNVLMQKIDISTNLLTFLTIPFAFPAAHSQSKAMWEVGWDGAAVWLTAAAVSNASV